MNDDLKVEDIFLLQKGDSCPEPAPERAVIEKDEPLYDRWKKWVEAVDG